MPSAVEVPLPDPSTSKTALHAATLWRAPQPLVLASRSPWRRELCAAAGIPIEAIPADIDERGLQHELEAAGASAADVAQALARAKAARISAVMADRLVVGADQTLAFGAEILHKPGDRSAATRQLAQLSGHTHELHSAIAVMQAGGCLFETVWTARLTMRHLSNGFIEQYLDAAGDQVFSSVGAYQLEGLGIHLFASVEGDYTTILGMPMLALVEFLRRRGIIAA